MPLYVQDCRSAWPTSAPDTSSQLFKPPTAISSHGAAPTATRDRSWQYGAAKSVDIADAIHATMSRVRQLARGIRGEGSGILPWAYSTENREETRLVQEQPFLWCFCFFSLMISPSGYKGRCIFPRHLSVYGIRFLTPCGTRSGSTALAVPGQSLPPNWFSCSQKCTMVPAASPNGPY